MTSVCNIALVCATAFLMVLSGCISAPPIDDPGPKRFEWGLGIALPAASLGLGPFKEPIEDIAFWNDWFAKNHESLRACENPEKVIAVAESDPPFLIGRQIEALFVACLGASNGNHSIEELARLASSSMEQNRLTLSTLNTFSTVSAAEVTALLMEHHLADVVYMQHLHDMYEAFKADTSQAESLFSIERGYQSVIGRARTLANVLQRVPLGPGPCVEDADNLSESTIERIEAMVETHAPNAAMYESGLGRWGAGLDLLVNRTHPRAGLAASYGWWPYLYAAAGEVPFLEEQFEWFEEDALPDFAEYQYLRTVPMNISRSILTDLRHTSVVNIDNEILWQDSPAGALLIMGLQKLAWRFGEMGCFKTATQQSGLD